MKIITVDDTIISLENVQSIRLIHTGTGAKTNPKKYTASVQYTHGGVEHIGFNENEVAAKQFLANTIKILKAD